ncbi:hypothetical protein L4C31_01820 [Aliivibrio sifiae]
MNKPYLVNGLLLISLIAMGYSRIASASSTENENESQGKVLGVMNIDVTPTNEKLQQYLLPLSSVIIENTSDAVLYDFINEKTKWEK